MINELVDLNGMVGSNKWTRLSWVGQGEWVSRAEQAS